MTESELFAACGLNHMNKHPITLKRRVFPCDADFPPRYDMEILRLILKESGYHASDIDIAWAWGEFSADYSSPWKCVSAYPCDDILATLRRYLEPIQPTTNTP